MLAARGLFTAQMADHLHISAHTVQDHLKSIFDKVGVRGRSALVSQILLEDYWPRRGDPLAADGYFGERQSERSHAGS